MKHCIRFAFVLVVLLTVGRVCVVAQSKAKAQNVPEIPYDSVPNFLKLPPNLYLSAPSRCWAAHRAGCSVLSPSVEFKPTR
jgi:hypothetical protein